MARHPVRVRSFAYRPDSELSHIINMYIYVQSADVRFAVLQLISAARNELGSIRDQSAQTAIRAVI